MHRDSLAYKTYVRILERELVPAMGCTEPIAIAYCAALARATLGEVPDEIHVEASGNVVKNVKSVVVPNTGGRKGIAAAAAIGAFAGDEKARLEVISRVSDEKKAALGDYIKNTKITAEPAKSDYVLDIKITVSKGGHSATVRSALEHTNIVLVELDGRVLEEKTISIADDPTAPDYSLLNVADILDFAKTCDLEDVRAALERQIKCNKAISDVGLKDKWGANVGKTLLSVYGDDVRFRARARAAAGSDARMNGCELPVVINSGSGNQGLTASMPVYEYARELGVDDDTMYRALLVSNLVTLHEKSFIGRLSAYCGAVSAGAGAGAGIAFLRGGSLDDISHTIINTLAITSGLVCDGAKSSCAAKISAAVDAGIIGYEMHIRGNDFQGGDGLVLEGVEACIENFGRLGRVAMRETDREIIRMMTENI